MSSDVLDAARAHLPAWIVWFPAITAAWAAAAAAAVVALLALVAARPAARLAPGAHWTERARVTWPARRAAWAGVGLAGGLGALAWTGGPLSRPFGAASGVLAPALAVVIAAGVAFAVEDRLVRRIPLGRRAAAIAAGATVLVPGWLLALLAPVLAPAGAPAWATAALLVAIALLQSYLGLALGRALGLVRAAPAAAGAALADACAGRPGPAPRLHELRFVAANAYALPLQRAIAVTPAIVEALPHDELVAVLRHELAHLDEPRAAKLARLGAAVTLPVAVAAGLADGGLANPLRPLACVALAVALLVAFRRLGRRLEERADRAAAPAAGATYASALERLHAYNLAPAVLRKGATHPDLVDRMAAAGAPPAWPRPAPPRAGRLGAALAFVAVVAISATATVARHDLDRAVGRDEASTLLALALRQDAGTLEWQSTWAARAGRQEEALALLAAAEALSPGDPALSTEVALWSAAYGRCEPARAALARAVRAGGEGPELDAARSLVEACVPPRGVTPR